MWESGYLEEKVSSKSTGSFKDLPINAKMEHETLNIDKKLQRYAEKQEQRKSKS